MSLDTAIAPGDASRARSSHPVSFFEFWPGWLFYTPVVVQWILLGLRYRDFSLPTAANPYITTGGLCGESKLSILRQIAPEAAYLVAPACGVQARLDGIEAAEAAMETNGLAYPVVAKPDIGCNGTGVRLVRDRTGLEQYLQAFPTGETLILQHYIAEPHEAGLFYVRHPHEATGRITSITIKKSPSVTGDGRRTLKELILADERAGLVPQLYFERLAGRLHDVPAENETVQLVFVGNHCKGSIFEDGSALLTPALTQAVDTLARALPEFHFGRLDVRFSSVAALRNGTGFKVIEVNGVGSEPTHIWDARTQLLDAWRSQFSHYAAVFRIGAANRRRGFRSCGLRTMYRAWKTQLRLMKLYPLND